MVSALAAEFADISQALFAAGSERDTLEMIVDLAVDTIEGCDFSGIFILDGDQVTAPARTAEILAEIDGLQRQTGEGPCLAAIAERTSVYAADLLEDGRWPQFTSGATGRGVRSVLAVPLLGNGALGALNLYSRYPLAFGVVDRAKAVLVAALASTALIAAREREAEERRADNLHAALATREVIGQAQGILMERERITADEAFDVLRRASQHLNRKLRDVAQTLVDTGEAPSTDRS